MQMINDQEKDNSNIQDQCVFEVLITKWKLCQKYYCLQKIVLLDNLAATAYKITPALHLTLQLQVLD